MKAWIREFWTQTEWPGRDLFSQPEKAWPEAQFLIRAFYCALFFFACDNFLPALSRYPTLHLDPLWPLFWTRWTGQDFGIKFALVSFVSGSLLAAWKPSLRAFRITAFLGCLEGMALDNSFGKINNHLHLWTLAAFLLIFLPREQDRAASPETRAGALRLFWGVQASILLTYTMSGVAKLLGAAVQIARGDAHTLFGADALARHVAERLMQTREISLLGSWLIEHPLWGWPAFLSAVYLETFALAAAFRPSLHRPWALGLILMHVGIFLTMNVGFSQSILLLSLFFFASPFAARPFTLRQRIRELPMLGPFFAAFRDAFFPSREKSGQTILFYDGVCGVCNRWVAFLLSRKLPADFRFATLQGQQYRALAAQYPALNQVDTMVLLRREGGEDCIRVRSEGVFWLLAQLPGWPRLALFVNLVPLFLLDIGYATVAMVRHRLVKPACKVFPPEVIRERFMEDPGIVG